MALTTADLVTIRQETSKTQAVNYTKAQINAAASAVEAQLQNTCKGHVNNAIESAAPGVFTNAQKKKIVAEVLRIIFLADK